MDKVHALLRKLEILLRKNNEKRILQSSVCISAVLHSVLLHNTYQIVKALDSPQFSIDLDRLLQKAAIQPNYPTIPPLPLDVLRDRISRICSQKHHEYFFVELPEDDSTRRFKRSGLILCQQIVIDEVEGLFVTGVETNSPASRACNLQTGDQLLVVSGFPLDGRTMEQLRYGLLDFVEYTKLHWNANLFQLASHLLDEPYRFKRGSAVKMKPPSLVVGRKRRVQSTACKDTQEQSTTGSKRCFETVIRIGPDSGGLGIQLKIDDNYTGIYIVCIAPGSLAEKDGVLKVGDRIIEVDHQDVLKMSAREALRRIKQKCQFTPTCVHFKVSRTVAAKSSDALPKITSLDHKMSSSILPKNVAVYSNAKSDVTVTAIPIPRSRQTDIRAQFDAVQYWNSQLPKGSEIVVAQYDIDKSACGLGVSIEGAMEQGTIEGTAEPHHYVVDVAADGPPDIRGRLMPGDELLQVNSTILYGLDHLEVAKILHNVPPQGYIVCARFTNSNVRTSDLHNHSGSEDEISDVAQEFECANLPLPILRTNESHDSSIASHPQTSSQGSSDVDKHPQTPTMIVSQVSTKACIDLTRFESADKKSPVLKPQDDIVDMPLSIDCDHSEATAWPEANMNSDPVDMRPAGYKTISARLPMPARPPLCHSGSHFLRMWSSNDPVPTKVSAPETPLHGLEEICLSLRVPKNSGEFLGLELESEDGGLYGIRLAGIMYGSPVARALQASRPRSHSDNPLRISTGDKAEGTARHPILRKGDWIVSMAGYSLCHESGFTARSVLRRLVYLKGDIVIQFIPYVNKKSWTATSVSSPVLHKS